MPRPSTITALRAHLREHDLSVLAASAVAALIALIGWLFMYGAAYWVAVFFFTVQDTGSGGLPLSFHQTSLSIIAALMLLAWLDQKLFPHERAIDERPAVEHLMDIALFLPRLTLIFFWNFAALSRLPRRDTPSAAALLDALRGDHTLPMQHLPLSLPDEAQRERILTALQNALLTEVRSDHGLLALRLSPHAPDTFRIPLCPQDHPSTIFHEEKQALPAPSRQLPEHRSD